MAEGVRLAQANDLEGAERTLSAAVGCPAAMRELAGVRVLQKRWAEAADLASAAVQADEADTYAWKVLGHQPLRAERPARRARRLEPCRRAAPRSASAFDGLTRTRHRAVEQLVHAATGSVLSPGDFVRARRRLAELAIRRPARGWSTCPLAAGLAELRGVVAERPLVPTGRSPLAAIGAFRGRHTRSCA